MPTICNVLQLQVHGDIIVMYGYDTNGGFYIGTRISDWFLHETNLVLEAHPCFTRDTGHVLF